MSITKKVITERGVAVAFVVGVFVFWRFFHQSALSFHEQQQLFLFTADYAMGRIVEPGGLARYMAEFIVQFFNNFNYGALFYSALFGLSQQLSLIIARRHCSGIALSVAVSLLPPLALLIIIGNADVMTTFVISFVLCQLVVCLLPKLPMPALVYSVLSVVVGYWLIGPVVALFVVYAAVTWLVEWGSRGKALLFAVVVLLVYSLVLVSSQWLSVYPLLRLVKGIDYFRFPMSEVPCWWLLLPTAFFPLLRYANSGRWPLVSVCIVLLASLVYLPFAYDGKWKESMDYELLVRMQRWNAIVEKAQANEPTLDSSRLALGLALWKTGNISAEQFAKGIHPSSLEYNRFSASVLGEAYFYLGLVNTARRYAFEQMESLPNYNLSGRLVKRLAETALVSGHNRLARTYIDLLRHTAFYSAWAEDASSLIGNRKALEHHPVYGPLAHSFPDKDIIITSSKKYIK